MPTLPIPAPPPIDYWQRWLSPGPPLSLTNDVKTLIDGEEAFAEIYRAMSTATGKGHFIYLLGWFLNDQYPLIKGEPATSLFEYARANKKIEVRVMLWREAYAGLNDLANKIVRQPPVKDPPDLSTNNQLVAKHLATLKNAAAIVDGRLPWSWCSHHQKLVVVNGSEGLIGLCGGVDINPDRIERKSDMRAQGGTPGAASKKEPDGSPLHDVHCAVRGPAARSLLDVFEQRWTVHPEARRYPPLASKASPPAAGEDAGKVLVQIVRTYNGVAGKTPPPLGSAGGGNAGPSLKVGYNGCIKEHSVAPAIFAMIRNARRFIYVEDQYMIDLKVADELAKARSHVQHIIFYIPHSQICDLPEAEWRRRQFITRITSSYPVRKPWDDGKLSTFNVYYTGDASKMDYRAHDYVHAKTWIVDDEIALVGSANCNRRGLSSDSEVGAIFVDNGVDGLTTAQRLRRRLWAAHLNLKEDQVTNALASARYWDQPPPGSRVNRYALGRDDRLPPIVPRETLDLNIDGDFDGAPNCPR